MGKVVSSVVKGVTGAVKAVVQPIYNATLKQIPGVDNALVNLDKSVGKAIPGGWGTIASIAASFIPGAQLATMGLTRAGLMTGLGALTGSGVMRKGNQFNLQGALMGGAAAYGLSNLASGLEAAGGGGSPTASQVASQLGVEGAATGPGSQAAMLAEQAAGTGSYGLSNIASSAAPAIDTAASQGVGSLASNGFAYTPSGEMVPTNVSPDITGAVSTPLQAQPSGLSNLATGAGMEASTMGKGIANLSGLAGGEGTAAAARAAFTGTGATLTNTAAPLVMGGMGLADLEAQRNYLDQQLASNTIAQSEYNAQVAEIDRQVAIARQAMAENPWNTNPDRTASVEPTAYDRTSDQYNLYDRAPSNLYANEPKLSETFAAAKGGMVPGYFGGGIMRAAADKIIAEQEAAARAANAPGIKAVAESPWNINPDRTPQNLGSTLLPKNPAEFLQYNQERKFGKRNYAAGGSIDDEMGFDGSPKGLGVGNMQNGFMGGGMPSYAKGGEARERREFLDMIEADFKSPPAQYVEGMGFVTPPPSVEGRLGANFDALGGNVRAGVSGNAMLTPDKKIMTAPGMMDIGYKGRVGPGDLDVGLQRAIRGVPGRGKDYAVTANYSMPFARGGNVSTEPRFLSGGGDGMSDSIPASINGRQEARLADGEFVVPADVVSHLGNGSSKAGAKRLYSMMDKVRKARTGTKKQGKQINPHKFMPA